MSVGAQHERGFAALTLDVATTLLRRPEALFTDDPADLAARAPSLLAVLTLGAGSFGVVVGAPRSALQGVYAGIKVPLLIIATLMVALPAVTGLLRASGSPLGRTRVTSALLVAGARLGAVAGAVAPWLWLALSLGLGYHASVLAVVATLGVSAVPALGVVRRVQAENRGFPLATVGAAFVLLTVGAQTGWLLRPFVGRPTQPVTFLRSIESNALDAVTATSLSAVGVYDTWSPRREGLAGRLAPAPVADEEAR